MKVLVTGGSGFLGSHVADALSDAGHEVHIYDLKPSAYLREDQKMIVGDIADRDRLAGAAAGCGAIYHMAALADIDDAINQPHRTVEVNVLGTLNALDAARHAGAERFVFSSSIYVYSSQGSFYRTSKQAAEMLIGDYQERYGLAYTILRFGSLYGPRSDRSNAVFRMLKDALEKKEIRYGGSGREIREYIHASDAAASSVEILSDEYENEIVHLTGRERITTREMMEMIGEILGGGVEISTNAGTMTGHYVQTPYSYVPKLGKKLVRHNYIDLGLGLLDCIQTIDRDRRDEAS